MIIPKKLYNPRQDDQSIFGYIEAYDEAIEIIIDRIENNLGFPEVIDFSDVDIMRGLELCLKINIALRMVYIFEKYCDDKPILIISERE